MQIVLNQKPGGLSKGGLAFFIGVFIYYKMEVRHLEFRFQAREYKYRPKRYSILSMSVKATKWRLNFNSIGNDDLMLVTQSGENLNCGL